MKYLPMGPLAPRFFGKDVYAYTKIKLPHMDMKVFKKRHMKEYKAMIARTPSIGSKRDNMFLDVIYLACYIFSYYKTAPDEMTTDILDGMINTICRSEMKKIHKKGSCFSAKRMERYAKGAVRSQKEEYPTDWVFDFFYDPSVPEYYVTYYQCGVCMLGKQENLTFLPAHMCAMDYPIIEFLGGKLLRTKTLANGDDCCDFHVIKGD